MLHLLNSKFKRAPAL